MFRLWNVRVGSLCIASGFTFCFILSAHNYLSVGNSNNYANTKSLNLIDTLLEMTRLLINVEMWNYNFSRSDVSKLEDLVLESGGTPIRTIIVSTWRSGSSFLGDLINAVPGNYYAFEPLKMFGTYSQIRSLPNATRAINLIKNILHCNFNNETGFHDLLKRNKRVWNKCNFKEELCYDADFTANICKLFPFQTIKINRLRLRFIQQVLDDQQLNVNVVLLVRDPRGVMQSRTAIKNFCSVKNVPDCAEAGVLCSDMVTDYEAAADFLREYPDRFMVLRYEDLSLELEETVTELLNFLKMDATPSVHKFIKEHTTRSSHKPYSTLRITKNIPFKWRKTLKFKEVNKIQVKCREAMSLWGYRPVHSVAEKVGKKFNPVLPYTVV